MKRFSPAVSAALGYYVYAYVDPRNEEIFYVGKGRKQRAWAHLRDTTESPKRARIDAIRAVGAEPRVDVLAHGLRDEEEAFRVEAAVIDALDWTSLTNQVRGWGTKKHGRIEASALAAMYETTPAEIVHDVMLIRINQTFRFGMTAGELYDATRGVWRIGPQREEVAYAMAVFEGVVQEVYAIAAWLPAGSTLNGRGDLREHVDRWEFVGNVADDAVRGRYRHRSVRDWFSRGGQSPVRYVRGAGDAAWDVES